LERRWNRDPPLGRPAKSANVADDLLLILESVAMFWRHRRFVG
jgi:hypothetical protein